MSWMDSWSRPKKTAVTPPPLYLTAGGENTPYCHSCGRVISTRKSVATKALSTPAKYCSERCKNHKPGKIDRRIEQTFVAILDGADIATLAEHPELLAADAPLAIPAQNEAHGHVKKKKFVKGDPRVIVECADVETLIFGSRYDPEKTHGRKKNKAKRTLGNDEDDSDSPDDSYSGRNQSDASTSAAEASAENTEDEAIHSDAASEGSTSRGGGVPLPKTSFPAPKPTDKPIVGSDHKNFGAGKVRPTQLESEVNFSVGGERGRAEKLEETPEMLVKRREGEKRANEREMVRCAARRLCAFGCPVSGGGGERTVEKEKQEDEGQGKRKKGKKGGKGGANGDSDEDTGVGKTASESKVKTRKCEAIMNSQAVESSYAKGDWGIRWREDQD